MRLIDADIFKNYITYGYLKDADKKRFSINDVIEMIDKQPTVDSVSGDKKMKILKKSNSDIRLVNKNILITLTTPYEHNFVCSCGCNVFSKYVDAEGKEIYVCHCCDNEYVGEEM